MEELFDYPKSSISIDNLYKVRAVIFPAFITLYAGEKRNLWNNILAFDGEGNDVHASSIPHPADNLKIVISDPDFIEIIRETSPTHTIFVHALQPIKLTHIRFYPKISVKKSDGNVYNSHFGHIYTDLIITIL